MWVAVALGPALSQPLAVMLDRVLVDIAINWIPDRGKSRAISFADAFGDLAISFERFSGLWETAAVAQYFRPAPVCFAPVYSSPGALYEAADRAAGFAHRIGTLLEERLGVRGAEAYAGIVQVESDDCELAARIDQLNAQTEELLRSGDWANIVLGHRMLLRAQALCALVARFRPLCALADSRVAAEVQL